MSHRLSLAFDTLSCAQTHIHMFMSASICRTCASRLHLKIDSLKETIVLVLSFVEPQDAVK